MSSDKLAFLRELKSELGDRVFTELPERVAYSRELVELEPGGYSSACCGSGGLLLASSEDLALRLASRRVKDAEEVGADALLTACTSCVNALRKGARAADSSVRVLDLAEALTEGLN